MTPNNLYLYVYNYIKENGKLPSDTISKQKLNYYVQSLKKQNLIDKVGYGVWKINPNKEVKQVKKVKGVTSAYTPKTRGHGFVFQVLLKSIEGWNKREEYLRLNHIPFKSIPQGQSITMRGHKVWLCDSSLVIYFSPKLSFYARSSDLSSADALIECKETLRQLETLFKTDLKYGKGWFINESRSHYADIRNLMAKYYRTMGVNSFEIVQGGKVWALIDNSFNLFELETIAGGGQSREDLPKLQMFLNDLRDSPDTLSNIKNNTNKELIDLYKVIGEQNKIIANLEAQIIRLSNLISK